MTLLIKICGLRSAEAVAAVVETRADFAGFVFFPPSPRNVELEDAAALAAMLPATIKPVALTVDADDRLLDAIAEVLRPALIQAHGRETPQRVRKIRERTGLPVMKALAIAEASDVAAADAYADAADRLLFDACPPKGASRPGGHGRPFDWSLARAYRGALPWMLSGGLTPDNVAQALAESGASALDVSSGVERQSGVKDPGLIRAFVARAREAAGETMERA